MPDQTKPLTESEIQRLDDFLYSVNPDEGMSMEELDGFFCALICSPELVLPSEYLPVMWGGKSPAFKDVEEAQAILTLITRHWNTIAATLLRDEPYRVQVWEQEDGDEMGQEWAVGFFQGMQLRGKAWERLMEDEEFGLFLAPVMLLVQDEEHRLSDEAVTEEDRDNALEALPTAVLSIYRYFRMEKPQRSPKKRTAVKRSRKKPN